MPIEAADDGDFWIHWEVEELAETESTVVFRCSSGGYMFSVYVGS